MCKIKLYNGDCFDVLKAIDEKSIDLVITDPPYLHVKGGMKSKVFNTGKTWSPDSYMNNSMSDFGREQILGYLDILKKKMKKLNLYCFCSKLQLPFYFEWITKNKAKFDLLFWDKDRIAMKSTKFFTSDVEYIVKIYEDGVSLNKIAGEDGKAISHYYTKRQVCPQPKGEHETMKPVELLKKYILLSSNEGDTVLDPFMGSGSTGIACVNTKRNFIGIEIQKQYYDISHNRIKDAIDKLKQI